MRTVGRCVLLVGISIALRKFSFHVIDYDEDMKGL